MRKQIFFVEGSAISYCPICGEPLTYRDTCRRIMLLEGRERRTYIIRRLKCHCCGRLHRELPDCLAPFKHYASEVIAGVLDGIVTPEDDDSADYPCEVTMHRWHHWLMINRLRIEGYLKSVGYRLLGFGEELLNTGMTLLEKLRSSSEEWLESILRFIYNSGSFLVSF
ncbi:MAG: DUF6431 domain-containing protein [Lachnospiraceae bacterium]|nr:DUF6431 domain-containing protein [Lachnospiraceae bacterium]